MPLMISTLLMGGDSVFKNIPSVLDVANTMNLLNFLGCSIKITEKDGKKSFHFNAEDVNVFEAPKDIVTQFRASFWILGPLLARHGNCKISLPGGCTIGARPVDIYLDSIRQMGVNIEEKEKIVYAEVIDKRLRGADITLRLPSVGVTHTLIMAGSLAKGKTTIRNAAREPEVAELGNYLIKTGAKIKGLGTNVIEVSGVEELQGQSHTMMADRIEAFSYAVAGIITDGDVILEGAKFFDILGTPLGALQRMGVNIEKVGARGIRIWGNRKKLKGADIVTDFFPGFPTDCQPLVMPLLASINSRSSISETIYESRFKYVGELKKMSADIQVGEDNTAHINGKVNSLRGSDVSASDLRAGMSLVLAGLAAKGKTLIENIHHIERGYENLVEKLQNVGADIDIT